MKDKVPSPNVGVRAAQLNRPHMPQLPTHRFDYRISGSDLLLIGAISVVVPAMFAYLASTNRRGLRISLIRLSPSQAVVFYWAVAALMLIAAGITLAAISLRVRGPHFLLLGSTEVVVPRASFRAEQIRVSYGDIRRIELLPIPKGKMVVLETARGESRISSFGFKSEREFEKFVRVLRERTSAA